MSGRTYESLRQQIFDAFNGLPGPTPASAIDALAASLRAELEKARAAVTEVEEMCSAAEERANAAICKLDAANALLQKSNEMLRDMREWQSREAVAILRARITAHLEPRPMTQISREAIEAAWAAIVGRDIAGDAVACSIGRDDLLAALIAAQPFLAPQPSMSDEERARDTCEVCDVARLKDCRSCTLSGEAKPRGV